MDRQKPDREISIKGIVTPFEWDKDFNVNAIKISTDDEKDYIIESDQVGKTLFRHIREIVEVRGEVKNGEDENQQKITVRDFKVIYAF